MSDGAGADDRGADRDGEGRVPDSGAGTERYSGCKLYAVRCRLYANGGRYYANAARARRAGQATIDYRHSTID